MLITKRGSHAGNEMKGSVTGGGEHEEVKEGAVPNTTATAQDMGPAGGLHGRNQDDDDEVEHSSSSSKEEDSVSEGEGDTQ